MSDDQLTSFVTRSRQKGRTDDQIKSALLSVGWKKERVDAAFASLSQQPAAEASEAATLQPAGKPQLQQPGIPPQQPAVPSQPQQPAPISQPAGPAQPSQGKAPAKKLSLLGFFGTVGKLRLPKLPARAQPQGAAQQPASQTATQPQEAAQQPQAASLPVQQPQRIVPPAIFPPKVPASQPSQAPAMPQPAASPQPLQPAGASQPQPAAKSQFLIKAAIVAILLIAAGAVYVMMSANQPASQPPAVPPINASGLNETQNNTSASGQEGANASSNGSAAQLPPAIPPEQPHVPPEQPAYTPPEQPEPQPPQVIYVNPPQEQPYVPPEQPVYVPPQEPAYVPPAQPEAPSPAPGAEQQSFARTNTYYTSGPFTPEKYCQNEVNGTFIRAHYGEYFGGECASSKDKSGFVNLSTFRQACELIPCCVAGPYREYSLKYDYFECGY